MRALPGLAIARAASRPLLLATFAALMACDGSATLPLTAPSAASDAANAERHDNGRGNDLVVMTYNIYQGTELENSVAATTLTAFVLGAAADFDMMRQTNFRERAGALAAEMRRAAPDVIGMQEVALWQASNPAIRTGQDFLAILLDSLAARGMRYDVAASVNNFDVQGPAQFVQGLTTVRLTDRNVILVRRGEDEDENIAVSNRAFGNFATNLVIPTVFGPTTVLEGWASIDITVRGRTIRFITTHLDAFAPPVRRAQAAELLAGPAQTSMPVILAGDLNSTTATETYTMLIGAGFSDLWPRFHGADPGLTCCQSLPAIHNPVSALYERVDMMLARGQVVPRGMQIVGAAARDRTASGLWPSDHAGLVATFDVKKAANDRGGDGRR